MTRGAIITGWGASLPDKVVTNDDLAGRLETSDDWIVERTGIRERRIGGTTAGLATEACGAALERASCAPGDVDLLILATMTPDHTCPATAPAVQHALGMGCPAFDVHAACAGFVYGLVTAHGFVRNGMKRVLLVGSEVMSRITDRDDRSTAILFADGAGAVLLEGVEERDAFLSWDLDTDGSLYRLVTADVGGALRMDGKEVFRAAVRLMVGSARRALERAGLTTGDIALVVPHQANRRIIAAACERLDIPPERTALVVEHTGNTSAASVPLALADAADAGRLETGDHVLMVAFGGGMTAGSVVLRWDPPATRSET